MTEEKQKLWLVMFDYWHFDGSNTGGVIMLITTALHLMLLAASMYFLTWKIKMLNVSVLDGLDGN